LKQERKPTKIRPKVEKICLRNMGSLDLRLEAYGAASSSLEYHDITGLGCWNQPL